MSAQVIVLAGPSGSGKSRLAERLRLPVLRLDDFYNLGSDPSLPRITHGANTGLVDLDHPDSWNQRAAVDAIADLCSTGRTDVPVYDIASSTITGTQALALAGRGWTLMIAQRPLIEGARAAGCRVLTSAQAHAELSPLCDQEAP